jgi:hypothetical protein
LEQYFQQQIQFVHYRYNFQHIFHIFYTTFYSHYQIELNASGS